MSSSNTPAEDFTRFENWLDGMTDIEFKQWYDTEATPKQKALADTLRESELEE